MTETLAFKIFVVVVISGLAALTMAMLGIVVVLMRRNRSDRNAGLQ